MQSIKEPPPPDSVTATRFSRQRVDLGYNPLKNLRVAVFYEEFDNGNSGDDTVLIDWTLSAKQKLTLTGNCFIDFIDPPGPCDLTLRLVQDSTGSRTVSWTKIIKWPNGNAPSLTTTANAIDIIVFYYDGYYYYGIFGSSYK